MHHKEVIFFIPEARLWQFGSYGLIGNTSDSLKYNLLKK